MSEKKGSLTKNRCVTVSIFDFWTKKKNSKVAPCAHVIIFLTGAKDSDGKSSSSSKLIQSGANGVKFRGLKITDMVINGKFIS